MSGSYRQYLHLDAPRQAHLANATAITHAEHLLKHVPLVVRLNNWWDRLWHQPFKGITSDGNVIPEIYSERDDGILINDVVASAEKVLAAATEEERKRLVLSLDAPERRAWSNPEIYIHRFGVRLDEASEPLRQAALGLLRAVLSTKGYEKAIHAMLINDFLGTLHDAHGVLNRWSYNLAIFGQPSTTDHWGVVWYGHHLCLSIALHKTQIILTPTFTGAEPNEIDEGPLKGTRILVEEQRLGLELMRRLPEALRSRARIFDDVDDPSFSMGFENDFPNCRWNPADQRHLCGAFQDNRVVPYEGICLSGLGEALSELVFKLVEEFVMYLPDKARQNRLAQVKSHLAETYFCWIGGSGNDDAFYYRIQSPVIICEFDHHSGVFLSNSKSECFHIHTIVRSPNGGDYGHALRSQV